MRKNRKNAKKSTFFSENEAYDSLAELSATKSEVQKMKINIPAALLTAAVMPCTAVVAADNTKIGYGQGTAVDEKNRPVDAVQFNSRFGDLDAFALSEDENRIIITFDQGYENGYTAKILDTLKEKQSPLL